MVYTYPAPPVTVTQGGTATEVHEFMKRPERLARRLRSLLLQRYIADFLLTGRYTAQGGAILYETGEEIFAADDPRAIAPGGEYPMTVLTGGQLAAAKTVKWGQATEVTDEAIARLGMNPVERALLKLANTNVRHVDEVAMAVIASKLTKTHPVTGSWTGADAGAHIIEDVLVAKAEVVDLAEGFDPNVITLRPVQFAKVIARMVVEGFMPRESQNNTVASGVLPDVLGLTWTASPNAGADPLLVDNTQLGGMADENLASPGFVRADGEGTAPVEVQRIRDDDHDQYKLKARRVTVPVVIEPLAGIRITGTGI